MFYSCEICLVMHALDKLHTTIVRLARNTWKLEISKRNARFTFFSNQGRMQVENSAFFCSNDNYETVISFALQICMCPLFKNKNDSLIDFVLDVNTY